MSSIGRAQRGERKKKKRSADLSSDCQAHSQRKERGREGERDGEVIVCTQVIRVRNGLSLIFIISRHICYMISGTHKSQLTLNTKCTLILHFENEDKFELDSIVKYTL